MSDRSPLEAAAAKVARDYGPELIATAKVLADASPDETVFMRLWLGIGEFARLGIFNFDTAEPAVPSTTALKDAPTQEESNDNGR